MEHRLLEAGIPYHIIQEMATKEVAIRWGILRNIDEQRREAEREQWSQATQTR